MPETSVVVPTYDRIEALQRAIESVLAQTYEDFEVVVVDDASTRDVASVVAGFDDDRIEFVQLEENGGANAARNVGIARARGSYVSFLDSDDEFHPQHLERAVETLASAPDRVGGVFTAFELAESGRIVNVSAAPDGLVTLEDILQDNVVGGFSCLTVRADVFREVGYLDEEMRSSQDYEFFVRLLDEYALRGLPDRLLTCHVESNRRISDDVDRKVAGQERLLEKHGDKLRPAGRSRTHYVRAFAYARAGEFPDARRHFRRAIAEDPTNWLAYYHLVATLLGTRGFAWAVAIKSRTKLAVYRTRSRLSRG